MPVGEAIVAGMAEVRANLLRTCLQTLGVILGVGSLVAVQGLNDAGRRQSMAFYAEYGGVNKIAVYNQDIGERNTTARQAASLGLTLADLAAIRKEIPKTQMVEANVWREEQIGSPNFHGVREVMGATADYSRMYSFFPARGRFLHPTDVETAASICVLGENAAHRYFGNDDPIGRTVTIGDTGFTVVGVMARKEFFFDDGQNALEWMNDITFIPLTAVFHRFSGDERQRVDRIDVVVAKMADCDPATQAIHTLLMRRHSGVEDFVVRNRADRLRQQAERMQVFNITFLVSGLVSLLVGGVVIMNISLAAFRERIREIGIRKALGAHPLQIAVQFLMESVLITSLGGLLGLVLGVGLAQGIGNLMKFPMVITPQMAVVGLLSSMLTGLFFGIYPAIRAARLNPVQALRYE